jgi:hypothetical protein
VTATACLLDACACPSPRLSLFGGRLVELTNRNQITFLISAHLSFNVSPLLLAAASTAGFLQTICDSNPEISQRITPLSSKDYISDLTWCEAAATFRGKVAMGYDVDAGSNDFKKSLQQMAIKMSSAFGSSHTVAIRWRSVESTVDTKTTIFNIGFSPVELKEAFVAKAVALQSKTPGFWLHKHEMQVSDIVSQKGFKFFVPVPPGFTDETLITALVEQGGLNPDYLMAFGFDVLKGAVCNAPSGDMFFMYAPAGCFNHGCEEVDVETEALDPMNSILQPPSRLFVTHADGSEHHIKVRKAGACNFCWHVPGRHSNCIYKYCCKMCLVRWDAMEGGGVRHACGQGEMSKEKIPAAFNPNMPEEAVRPESDIAAELRMRMESKIRDAKRKRSDSLTAAAAESRDDENYFDEEEEEEAEEKGAKSAKASPHASPSKGGTSP